LDAERIGTKSISPCPSCGITKGSKLTKDSSEDLAHRFFIWGSLHRCDYGAATLIQFNDPQQTSIEARQHGWRPT